MKRYLISYAAALVALGIFDAIWLGIVAPDFYRAFIGHLMADKPRLDAALMFYLLYPLGVLLFAVRPTSDDARPTRAIWLGAAFGFFSYATYDLTNLATLRDWSVLVTLVDICWGSLISAIAAWAGFKGARLVGR